MVLFDCASHEFFTAMPRLAGGCSASALQLIGWLLMRLVALISGELKGIGAQLRAELREELLRACADEWHGCELINPVDGRAKTPDCPVWTVQSSRHSPGC